MFFPLGKLVKTSINEICVCEESASKGGEQTPPKEMELVFPLQQKQTGGKSVEL